MGRRGFTLLEVMVALAILAFLMAAITTTQGSSLLHGARVYNLTTATQLVDGIVLELEEEYRLDGFPENSLEGRRCDLPRGFDDFDCEYDLLAVDIGADNMGSLGESAMNMVNGSPLIGALCGAPGAAAPPTDPAEALAGVDMQTAALGAIAAMMQPGFTELCGFRFEKMCQNIPLIASFIPTIIEQAARSTRKLVIRLSWDERGNARKTMLIETYMTAVPEAEEKGP